MTTEATHQALRTLLDDDSPVVRSAVLAELASRKAEGIDFLRVIVREGGAAAVPARRYLQELGTADTGETFRAFIRSFRYELETGCLLLEQVVLPDLDPAPVCRFLDRMADCCREWLGDRHGPFETCKVINRVMFHDFHFSGDAVTFHDPQNSFLSSVIRKRSGIPLSLSTLYLLVAARCGLHLEPVGLPGHFLLAWFGEDDVFFLDPFDRGRFRSEEEVRQILLARNIEDAAEYLVPSTVGEMLCRYCRNLVHQYTLANDLGRARIFAGFVREFEDAYARHAQP